LFFFDIRQGDIYDMFLFGSYVNGLIDALINSCLERHVAGM